MKTRLFVLTVLVSLVVPVAAGGRSAAYGVAIRGATVNRDRSVTVIWSFENPSVFNSSITVDGHIVRGSSDRATAFRTAPLPGGWHAITVEAHEMFETYTPVGSACEVTGGHWVCARTWRNSIRVRVTYEPNRRCTVPRVVGLRLGIAKSRIRGASCSLGTVKRVHSKRRAGTVLVQRPKPKKRLLEGAAISLVVSDGRPGPGARASGATRSDRRTPVSTANGTARE